MSDVKTTQPGSSSHRKGQRALLVLDGGEARVHPLPDLPSITIGRGKDADLRIDQPSLSRVHARLCIGSHVTLEDMGSSNGTFIGGVRLTPGTPVLVAPGAHIELGGIVVVLHAGPKTASILSTSSGSKDGLHALERLVVRVAQSDLAVLVVGETGTGKSQLARKIHEQSNRAQSPFLLLDAATLDPTVIRRLDSGTLVLDEIVDTPESVQRQLVRELESLPRKVRVISTSRQDVANAVEAGRVLPELYHRINGITVVIPPLRARVKEIGTLAQEMASAIAESAGRSTPLFSPDALTMLERHRWPGNVRELEMTVERAMALCNGRVITASHIVGLTEEAAPAYGVAATVNPIAGRSALREAREDAEYQRIVEALRATRGNQTQAAKMLGISRGTLVARLERFNMPRPRK